MATLGEKLRRLRTDKGLLLEQVQEHTGIHFSTLAQYERDERTPSVKRLKKLADYYGVTFDFLIGNVEYTTTDKNEPRASRNQAIYEEDIPRGTTVYTTDAVRDMQPIYNVIPDDDPDVRARIEELLKLFAGLSPVSRESILDMAKFLTMKDRENTAKPGKKSGKNRHDI